MKSFKIRRRDRMSVKGPDYIHKAVAIDVDNAFVAMLDGGSVRVGSEEENDFEQLVNLISSHQKG